MSRPEAPGLGWVMRIDVDLGPPHDVGPVSSGYRRVLPITGGVFAGDRLKGTVVPGGADWNLVGADQVMRLKAEYLLKTEDGVFIGVCNEGLVRGAVGQVEGITRDAAPGDAGSGLYTRFASRYEAPTGPYDWLNRSIFVGLLHPPEQMERVSMDIYEWNEDASDAR